MKFPAFLAFAASCLAQESHKWTDRAGHAFSAAIVACDGVRATLDIEGRGKTIVPLATLSAADVEFLRHWRVVTPEGALIDPTFLPPWPAQTAAQAVTVQMVEDDATTHSFTWESAHFRIASDLRLPSGIVRDLAAVFEGTREVILGAPLGLMIGSDRTKYAVQLFSDAAGYSAAGGPTGSGGFFNGRAMLILLPNLGIKPGTSGLTAEHAKNLFVLKHEVTHQFLRPWGWALPPWLDEGFAECVASWPYTQGRYSLQNLDAAMHDYLLKWRRGPDRRTLRLIAPPQLMSFSDRDWQAQVASQSAYDLYNSAALLTHYFLRHDGRGDGAGLAAYFDAVRRGTPPPEAEETHLLHGRTRADLKVEIQKLAKRLGLDATLE